MRLPEPAFIGEVPNRAERSSRGAALSASRASFQTVGDRLQEGEVTELAAQLSDELGRSLEEHGDTTEVFGFNEFVGRVAERDQNIDDSDETTDLSTAALHARVVVDVLADAVSEGLLIEVRTQLPDEYDQLFELADAQEHPGQE